MPAEQFFVPPKNITRRLPIDAGSLEFEDIEETVIVNAMIEEYRANLKRKGGKHKIGSTSKQIGTTSQFEKKPSISTNNLNFLVGHFRQNPVLAQAVMRVKFLELVNNPQLEHQDKSDLLDVYLSAFLNLIPKLDKYAFPSSPPWVTFEGMPLYLPDGFSDLDFNPEIDEEKRTFEKMRVDKNLFYKEVKLRLFGIFLLMSEYPFGADAYITQRYLIETLMMDTNKSLPYDYEKYANRNAGKSVLFHTYRNAEEAVSVCRQHAIDLQLLLQIVGIPAGLFKCFMDEISHVCNMWVSDIDWSILDATNPEIDLKKNEIRPFIYSVPPAVKQDETWIVQKMKVNESGQQYSKKTTYESRRKTFYRILSNILNPIQ